jgi:hypothetical protein
MPFMMNGPFPSSLPEEAEVVEEGVDWKQMN